MVKLGRELMKRYFILKGISIIIFLILVDVIFAVEFIDTSYIFGKLKLYIDNADYKIAAIYLEKNKDLFDFESYSNIKLFLYIKQGRYMEALDFAKSRLSKLKNNPCFLNNLAIVFLKLGELPKAVILAKKALKLDGNNYNILDTMALIFEKLGEDKKALAIYEKIYNTNKGSFEKYIKLLAKYSRWSEILSLYYKNKKSFFLDKNLIDIMATAFIKEEKKDDFVKFLIFIFDNNVDISGTNLEKDIKQFVSMVKSYLIEDKIYANRKLKYLNFLLDRIVNIKEGQKVGDIDEIIKLCKKKGIYIN